MRRFERVRVEELCSRLYGDETIRCDTRSVSSGIKYDGLGETFFRGSGMIFGTIEVGK